MTGVGAATTADARTRWAGFYPLRDIKRHLLKPSGLACDREGRFRALPAECRSPAYRQFSADTVIEFTHDLNRDPVIHRWHYKIDTAA